MLESSRFCQRGQHQRAVAVRRVRSDRGPRARQRYIGVTWKPVRPVLVLGDHTGKDETGHQHPGRVAATSLRDGAKRGSSPKGTRRNAANGALGVRGGSRSGLVVPSIKPANGAARSRGVGKGTIWQRNR